MSYLTTQFLEFEAEKAKYSFVNEIYADPNKIEKNFKVLFKEFQIGRAKIDIIGRDNSGNLCLVNVIMKNKEINATADQLREHQSLFLRFSEIIGASLAIRIMVMTPFNLLDLGARKVNISYIMRETPTDMPTSREIYGLHHENKH